MPWIFRNAVYPDECTTVEDCVFCYPRGAAEYKPADAPRRVAPSDVPQYATWAPLPIVDDVAASVADGESIAQSIFAERAQERAGGRAMLKALGKLAQSRVSTYTLDQLNDLEAAAGLEDVVTGDGQMLKKDRHRLLKKAARGALMDMGK